MNMNKKVSNEYGFLNQHKRNIKRNKKSRSTHESWCNNDRDRDRDRDSHSHHSHEPSEDEVPHVPGMEYAPMFWQQPQIPQTQHHTTHNGQRLFTAMSDPSVCGYSAVPVTYAMEPVSLPPMYRLYQPVVRPNYRLYPGRTRSSLKHMQTGPPCDVLGNGYSSLQDSSWNQSTRMAYQNGDYASLPPTANTDNKDNRQQLSSEQRRYSDPGLGPADLPINSKSEDSDSTESNSSVATIGKSNKLFLTLIEQMTKMKETNSQLFKELHQAKLDLETVKTELQLIKQNVPCDYKPGMLSDIIKEIREASKLKEETMLSKVKLLIENQQSEQFVNLEQLKSQLEQVRREKEEGEERIGKLEKEVAALRLGLNSCYSSSSSSENREIAAFEEENLALRRELQEALTARAASEASPTSMPTSPATTPPTPSTTTTTTTTTTTATSMTTTTTTTTTATTATTTTTKMEQLMEILREKTESEDRSEDKEPANKSASTDSSSSSSSDDYNDDAEDDYRRGAVIERPRIFTSHDTSKNDSCNNSSSNNSVAIGPVTDL